MKRMTLSRVAVLMFLLFGGVILGSAFAYDRATDRKDIVDTAISAGSFQTLVAAVKAAGLVETLKGEGPFTLFAPTDEAFAKLPPGTLEDLLKPENKAKLQGILTYHVVPGKVPAADVVKLQLAGQAPNMPACPAHSLLTYPGLCDGGPPLSHRLGLRRSISSTVRSGAAF